MLKSLHTGILVLVLVMGPGLNICESAEIPGPNSNNNETQAIIFLEEYNVLAMAAFSKAAFASWAYSTNITDYNSEQALQASLEVAAFSKNMSEFARSFDQTGFSYDTKRQLSVILDIGSAALEDQDELEELNNILTEMGSRYSKGKPCDGKGTCYSLEPDLTRIMSTSRDYGELLWAWNAWRAEVGAPARSDYQRYVELKNKAAVANNQPDAGAYWRSYYEVDNLPEIAMTLYEELRPLYENLHAYVRRKLFNLYGSDYINLRGPIPAHVLGNMWAQSWSNIYDLCEPYPGKQAVDVTPALVAQNYTALKMFQLSDDFFASLGLIRMPQAFWDHSMIERPDDGREVVCHASAWDFSNGIDYRIKQCTDITMDDFITIHHEMGHIEYFLQYKDQPLVYQGGANPGFHEAVGDVLALSVSTPKHLKEVGLIDEVVDDDEADLNFLMSVALDKIAFLPFGYLMDQWRWSIFDGSTPESEYNQAWWDLRLQYQGIMPPIPRSEADFDAGAKFHIPNDVPYIRYFISFVLQFQFHEALCKAANHTGPLYKCDIYRSQEAGTLLSNMLQKGSSEPWPYALDAIVGSMNISAQSLVDYFSPLIDYLEEQNTNNGDMLGWPETFTPRAPTVTVAEGQLLGKTVHFEEDEFLDVSKDIDIYLGVPFADPPRRFKPPEAKAAWHGYLDVTDFKPACMQGQDLFMDLSPMKSEDCLYLNVFTPSPKPNDAAVMVFIHGGGFETGTAMTYAYYGTPLVAVGDVIVVTINYRLGVFSKLTTKDDQAPGNVGMLDQVMALEWIHTNIAAFGGDPNRITIFGESAGSASVEFHTLSKLSRGFFNQAIMESGAAGSGWAVDMQTPEMEVKQAHSLGEILDCSSSTSSSLIACLDGKSEEEILDASRQVYMGYPVSVDGDFLHKYPSTLYQTGDFKHCPTVTGFNKDEGTLFFALSYPELTGQPTLPNMNLDEIREELTRTGSTLFGESSNDLIIDSVLQEYIDWSVADNSTTNFMEVMIRIFGDYYFSCPADIGLRYHAQAGDSTFKYYFTHVPSMNIFNISWLGAGHSEELPFVFGMPFIQQLIDDPRMTVDLTDEEKAFSVKVMTFWTNFAKTGDPSKTSSGSTPGSGADGWPPYTIPELAHKVIDMGLGEGRALKASECRFWNHYLPKLQGYLADMDEATRDWKEHYSVWQNDLSEWQNVFNEYKASPTCD